MKSRFGSLRDPHTGIHLPQLRLQELPQICQVSVCWSCGRLRAKPAQENIVSNGTHKDLGRIWPILRDKIVTKVPTYRKVTRYPCASLTISTLQTTISIPRIFYSNSSQGGEPRSHRAVIESVNTIEQVSLAWRYAESLA